jgi:hypothetical protein
VNSNVVVSLYHTMAMKCHLEGDEVEKQLKYKLHDVGLSILGCFEEYHTKVQFNLMAWGGGGGLKPVYA